MTSTPWPDWLKLFAGSWVFVVVGSAVTIGAVLALVRACVAFWRRRGRWQKPSPGFVDNWHQKTRQG